MVLLMKMIKVSDLKGFASTFFADPVLQLAVNAAAAHAPSVEIVLCGECVACGQPDCPMNGSPGEVSVSDFCSYGVRRTDVN